MDHLDRDLEDAKMARAIAGPFAGAFFVQTKQGDFLLPIEDMHVGKRLRQDGRYATNELRRLSDVCGAETRVLVVGAHVGALCVPLAKNCAQLTAIEANPKTFALLERNIVLNALTNVQLHSLCASDKNGALEFWLNRINTGGSKRAPKTKHRWYDYDQPEQVSVRAARLDDVLTENFDVIIMDIEGSETFALRGMPRLLSAARVLQVEFLPHHLQMVAGVSVEEFLAPIAPHFSSLQVPSKRRTVTREDFASVLLQMFAREEEDAGLIFTK